jgi:ATP-binding cassette subfamily F protein uup
LSFKEARELESLPSLIEALETEKQQLTQILNSPDFYASRDLERIKTVNDRWKALEDELEAAYHRWDELETLKAALGASTEGKFE